MYALHRISADYFVPDPSITFMWYSVFEVERVGRVDDFFSKPAFRNLPVKIHLNISV